jgi:hypothetical protein
MVRARKTPDEKRAELRETLWPGSSQWCWDRHHTKGFITIPRLLPWILHLLKHLAMGTKTGDPSPAYVDLWARSFDGGFVEIKDEKECAFASGYATTRALRTWTEHMMTLVDSGFILVCRRGLREFGYVLLLNPLAVAARLQKEGRTPEGWWSSFLQRAQEISATVPGPLDLPKGLKKMK